MGCGRSIYFLQRLLHSKLFSVNFDRGIHKSTDNKQVSRTKVSLVVKKWRSLYLLSNIYTRILPRFFFFLEKNFTEASRSRTFFLLRCEWFITSIVFSSTWIFRDPDLPKATYKVHSWNKRFCLKGSLGLSHLHACKGPFPPRTNNIFY